jgi:tetratricopeptide (TPR) repeat protein
MLKKLSFVFILLILVSASFAQNNQDTILVLPFENTSGRPEFNWVGESFADSLSDLLKVPSVNVVINEERKIIQQKLNVPLTTLPSLATSLKLARDSKATLLVSGKYSIAPAQENVGASVSVTAKIIRVNEGRFLSEEMPDGRKITRDINLSDALANLQTVQGQLAYQVLYQRDKALPFSQNQFVEAANKIPSKAFEAYIKGLLTKEADSQTKENLFKNAMRLYSDAKSGETYTDASLELGHLFMNRRDFQNSVDYFSRIPQTDVHFAEAAFYIGLINWRQNNLESSLNALRPLGEELKLTSVYNAIGAIALHSSRAEKKNKAKSEQLLTESLDFLKQASESSPDDPESRFNYSLALFVKSNYPEVINQLSLLLAANPRDGEAYFLLAKAKERLADASWTDFDNQARRFLTNYAKLETDWSRSRSTDAIPVRIEQISRQEFAGVIMKNRKNTVAQTSIDPTENMIDQAKSLYKSGRDDDALQILLKILSSEPMSAESHLLIGKIHLRRGEHEQAVGRLKTALFWDNRLIEANIELGKIFIEKKDCLQAMNYAKSALEINAENQEALNLQRLADRCGK